MERQVRKHRHTHSAVQKYVTGGCVKEVLLHATFGHDYLHSRVYQSQTNFYNLSPRRHLRQSCVISIYHFPFQIAALQSRLAGNEAQRETRENFNFLK